MSFNYTKPGVYVEETLLTGANELGTASTTFLFVGSAPKGRTTTPIRVESWVDFTNEFGGFEKVKLDVDSTQIDVRNYLPYAVYSFFQNGGRVAYIQRAFSANNSGEIASFDVVASGVENRVIVKSGSPSDVDDGVNGDFYVDSTDHSLYGPKAAGAWGPANDYLPGGFSGDVFSGKNSPAASTGVDGDFYVRTGTGTTGGKLYGPKADGAWPTTTLSLYDNSQELAFTVEAKSPGTWGNSLSFATQVDEGTGADRVFTLQVYYDGTAVETFSALSIDGAASGTKTVEEMVNDPVYGSSYVRITNVPSIVVQPGEGAQDYTSLSNTALTGGIDPTAASQPELTTALSEGVGKIEGAVVACVAGYLDSDDLYVGVPYPNNDVLERGDVVFIDDFAQPRTPGDTSSSYKGLLLNEGPGSRNSGESLIAAYAPWIIVSNPGKRGATITVPPAGAVMGVIARTDSLRGPYRAPAGIEAVIVNSVGVDTKFRDDELGELNTKGVNIIRPVTGQGICVMGARTRKKYAADKYLSARRTLIYLRETLRNATEFAVFENNDEVLWARLAGTAERVLRPVWSGGGLRGNSAAEAYFIKCDGSINTPATIAAGEVRMDIGVALEYPAEFVIIRLTQFEQGGSNIEIQPGQ